MLNSTDRGGEIIVGRLHNEMYHNPLGGAEKQPRPYTYPEANNVL